MCLKALEPLRGANLQGDVFVVTSSVISSVRAGNVSCRVAYKRSRHSHAVPNAPYPSFPTTWYCGMLPLCEPGKTLQACTSPTLPLQLDANIQ